MLSHSGVSRILLSGAKDQAPKARGSRRCIAPRGWVREWVSPPAREGPVEGLVPPQKFFSIFLNENSVFL